MALNDTAPDRAPGPEKPQRARVQRACDLCRMKKIRCNGQEMPDNRCSKCISYGVECTYEAVNKRPPSKSYVEILESRLHKMEQLFDQLQPQTNPPPLESHITPSYGSSSPSPDLVQPICAPTPQSVSPPLPPSGDADDLDPSDDEMNTTRKLMMCFRKFAVRTPPAIRYHGKSSGMMLLQTAVNMKYEYTGTAPRMSVPTSFAKATISLMADPPPHTEFPPPDLMAKLIDAYFDNLNLYAPLLHRPTFDKQIREGLHLQEEGFGSVLLLVCANGCRWYNECARFEDTGPHTAPGWQWFLQVENVRKSIFVPPRLTDMQRYALMAEYLGSYRDGSPHNCWTLIGMGIRTAQDIGAHREKTYGLLTKAEGELWRRAFWTLLMFDRSVSFSLGRPCALQDEDFDVKPPIECDDEYWETGDPLTDFKQPTGKPSTVTFLNCHNQLLQILAFALRTIYSINKSKLRMGYVGHEWEEHTVSELDSLLNKWIDTVPDHLRWDPDRESHIFLNQSAALYAKYYQLQIFVHRPFLPSTRKSSRLTLPSLAICTNAARSCVHVSDVQFRRTGTPVGFNRMPLFTAGIVLLINMWGGKRAGLSNTSAVADVQKCMAMLKLLESQGASARRLWDIMDSLYSAGDFESTEPTNRKRQREEDQPEQPIPAAQSPPDKDGKLMFIWPVQKSKRPLRMARETERPKDTMPIVPSVEGTPGESMSLGGTSTEQSEVPSPASFDLPMRTAELGRVPFNAGFSSFYDPGLSQETSTQNRQLQQTLAQSSLNALTRPQMALDTTVALDHSSAPSFGGPSQINPGNLPKSTDLWELAQTVQDPASGQAVFQFAATQDPAQTQFQTPPQAQVPQVMPTMDAQPSSGPFVLPMSPFTMDDLALADNTLDMWSTAPMSLDVADWADWGEFVNNMSSGAVADWSTEGQF
ncbi:fungal-specific transcription factor domain-containing protein [Trametes gibbosa]|nr:fungal-specific transcription factor domain-containing protein [Trametes gibbosa]UVI59148.1 Zn(2)-Cys(6)50 [Trametes gibbosa]